MHIRLLAATKPQRLPSITEIINRYIKDKDIRKAAIARKLNITPSNLQRALNKNSLDNVFIQSLCKALEHDFFQDLSIELLQEMPQLAKPVVNKKSSDEVRELKDELLQLHRDLKKTKDELEQLKSGASAQPISSQLKKEKEKVR